MMQIQHSMLRLKAYEPHAVVNVELFIFRLTQLPNVPKNKASIFDYVANTSTGAVIITISATTMWDVSALLKACKLLVIPAAMAGQLAPIYLVQSLAYFRNFPLNVFGASSASFAITCPG
jgi:hypothetical protein